MCRVTALQLDELWIYPVKSCHGIRLRSATLAERGFAGDREWMVVDERSRFMTQRTMPLLARIVPQLSSAELCLSAPGQRDLVLPRDLATLHGTPRSATIWSDTITALDAGNEAANWLRGALGVTARLLRATAETLRQPEARWRGNFAAPVNFPDAFPLLICNQASLGDLNVRMGAALPMTRFRPNIVISGLAAYAEDEVHSLSTGTIDLRLVKPSSRCSTTAVDQDSGVVGLNPLPTLKTYRYDRNVQGVTFGQNALIAAGEGQILQSGLLHAAFR